MAFDFFDSLRPKRKALDPDIAARIPPGQTLTEKWPVLHYGGVPREDLAKWSFRIFGLVEEPVTLNWQQFMALPHRSYHNDIHCVTHWTKLNNDWEGVPFEEVLKLVKLKPNATHVMVHADTNFTANLALEELQHTEEEARAFFAFKHDGEELSMEHGWPLRLVVPKLYLWKSAKWVRGLEFMERDRPGFWESYGYHMHGDPWLEERYG